MNCFKNKTKKKLKIVNKRILELELKLKILRELNKKLNDYLHVSATDPSIDIDA